jgi:hypothetical protein
MAKMRPMSVLLILISSGISILIGVLLDRGSPGGTANFRAVYYGARCLIHRVDPYNPDEFLRVYAAESGEFPSTAAKRHLFLRAVPVCVNLPTTLFLVAPLALMPWSFAHSLWLCLIALCFTLAGLLTFDVAGEYAPGVSLFLVCILLADSPVLFAVGNTAGIAVSLCVVAVWCFVRKRWEWAGVVCLAVSLALKPHDSGLVWLCLLLLGGSLRKRSLQALAFTVVLAIPAVMWVSQVAPGWSHELRANLASTSARGDISDPGPTSISRQGTADIIIDLQTVLSIFRDDPGFYNPVVYGICALLIIVWAVKTVRIPNSNAKTWSALAVAAPLTMLFSYHRPYDARLLMLAIPALAMLWANRASIRRLAFLVTASAVILTGDIPLAVLSLLAKGLNIGAIDLAGKLLSVCITRPVPLLLLFLCCFNLTVYYSNSLGAYVAQLESDPHLANSSDVAQKLVSE